DEDNDGPAKKKDPPQEKGSFSMSSFHRILLRPPEFLHGLFPQGEKGIERKPDPERPSEELIDAGIDVHTNSF
ncbi:MAG: hypothetical protein ABI747_01715, partial [Candidatus Moraniibacteriota bacterium]